MVTVNATRTYLQSVICLGNDQEGLERANAIISEGLNDLSEIKGGSPQQNCSRTNTDWRTESENYSSLLCQDDPSTPTKTKWKSIKTTNRVYSERMTRA